MCRGSTSSIKKRCSKRYPTESNCTCFSTFLVISLCLRVYLSLPSCLSLFAFLSISLWLPVYLSLTSCILLFYFSSINNLLYLIVFKSTLFFIFLFLSLFLFLFLFLFFFPWRAMMKEKRKGVGCHINPILNFKAEGTVYDRHFFPYPRCIFWMNKTDDFNVHFHVFFLVFVIILHCVIILCFYCIIQASGWSKYRIGF